MVRLVKLDLVMGVLMICFLLKWFRRFLVILYVLLYWVIFLFRMKILLFCLSFLVSVLFRVLWIVYFLMLEVLVYVCFCMLGMMVVLERNGDVVVGWRVEVFVVVVR